VKLDLVENAASGLRQSLAKTAAGKSSVTSIAKALSFVVISTRLGALPPSHPQTSCSKA